MICVLVELLLSVSSFTHAQITDQLAYRRNAGEVTPILDGDHRQIPLS